MEECKLSEMLADFLIELAVNPELYAEFQANRAQVVKRKKFGLSKADRDALMSDDPEVIRNQLANVQVHP